MKQVHYLVVKEPIILPFSARLAFILDNCQSRCNVTGGLSKHTSNEACDRLSRTDSVGDAALQISRMEHDVLHNLYLLFVNVKTWNNRPRSSNCPNTTMFSAAVPQVCRCLAHIPSAEMPLAMHGGGHSADGVCRKNHGPIGAALRTLSTLARETLAYGTFVASIVNHHHNHVSQEIRGSSSRLARLPSPQACCQAPRKGQEVRNSKACRRYCVEDRQKTDHFPASPRMTQRSPSTSPPPWATRLA